MPKPFQNQLQVEDHHMILVTLDENLTPFCSLCACTRSPFLYFERRRKATEAPLIIRLAGKEIRIIEQKALNFIVNHLAWRPVDPNADICVVGRTHLSSKTPNLSGILAWTMKVCQIEFCHSHQLK